MAKKPRKSEPVEDPDQSRRFLKLVADLEAAGELKPNADAAFERAMLRVEKDAAERKKADDS